MTNDPAIPDEFELDKSFLRLQSKLVQNYKEVEEIWKYHPKNPKYINPITKYNDLINQNKEIEGQLDILLHKIIYLPRKN
jgi:hypothetical protein